MNRAPMIAKRGRLVVETESGLRPATRQDMDGAHLVGARGPIYVETAQGLQPATIRDARSAVGRIARGLVKNPAAPFADDRALAVRAGRESAKKLTTAERIARAKKGWVRRRGDVTASQ